MRHPRVDIPVGTCLTCGKKCYLTRKAARRDARRILPAEHLNAYQCGRYWHLGHLPAPVARGTETRADITANDVIRARKGTL